jgi:ribosomal-protein-alanine N-acetyltransferase
MDDVHIYPASCVYADVLAAVHGQCFASAWDAAMFRSSLQHAAVHCAIAAVSEVPVGVYQVRWAVDQADLETICVCPTFRGRGYARHLLQDACAFLQKQDVEKLFLDVAEDNSAARALYYSMGFVDIDVRRHYYGRGQHAKVMCRDLQQIK